MSDPVSNREIEDVLSSIRRLVSVDKRDPDQDDARPVSPAPEPGMTEGADGDPDGGADDGKLVLTPSFRVAEGSDHTDETPPNVSDADQGDDSLSLEQWQIHPQEQDENTSQERDTDHDDPGEHDLDPPENTAKHDDSEGDERPGADSELEARIAEVEAAVAAREDEWEPDDDVGDDYFARNVKPLPWEDYTADDTAEPVADHAPADEQEQPEFSRGGIPQGATPEPEQASQAVDEDAYLDDAEETLDFVSRRDDPMPQDSQEPAETAQEPNKALDTSTSDRPQDWYSDDAVLDEDALRDLVADIVRQELQGALGERITRNVRKLVRREIHRAMMGQDLD